MLKKATYLLVLFHLLIPPRYLYAYDQVQWKLSPATVVFSGDSIQTVKITMEIANGWYTYGIVPHTDKGGIGPQPTEITLLSDILEQVGKLRASKPLKKFDKGFQIDVEVYEKKAEFWVDLHLRKNTQPGKYQAALLPYYQICDSVRCLPPKEDTLWFTVIVQKPETEERAEAQPQPTVTSIQEEQISSVDSAQPQVSSSADGTDTGEKVEAVENVGKTESITAIEQKKQEGLLPFLLFAMGAGAFALLTPCVFPMVPITVSYFTKRAEKKQGKAIRDALIYALGIVLTFTGIGFIVSLLFGATGIQSLATDPWINLLIAAIFIAFALNLFGAFEIRIPAFLLKLTNTGGKESEGIWGILLMGFVFSLTTFTCTVPFVGSALIAAASGEWFYPIVGMAGFSLVFAVPFFALAAFPALLQKLPRAGGWMNNIKVVMGFLELAAALKFISNADLVFAWGILPRELFLSIWSAISLLIALYILGVFRFHHDSPVEMITSVRAILATFFASIALYLFSGIFGASLGELDAFVPPPEYREWMSGNSIVAATVVTDDRQKQQDHWYSSLEEATEVAKREKKLMFIDFTGFTCTNCRWMERNIFILPHIQQLLDQMVKVRLFTDRRGEPYESNKRYQQEKFGSIELPLYAILTPEGEVIGTKSFTRDEEEFAKFLQQGLNVSQ